ncbi:hypothetical protein PPERSA_02338 [Pseudocohnilembus persalinus]|uniref:Uncharacterized protein n=1 Tax=Pseudocohnilembus persalinus TaxID=266149 RepID=A0A0V0QU72_PSEPJ|nr:hypothetical protein PPERSA_02338 [Pseudocohnilembus persalinus]|eukprot:KRX05806.1 hypothetical protein PPERSA_02338 [Pseudocohnilembus persalinus]
MSVIFNPRLEDFNLVQEYQQLYKTDEIINEKFRQIQEISIETNNEALKALQKEELCKKCFPDNDLQKIFISLSTIEDQLLEYSNLNQNVQKVNKLIGITFNNLACYYRRHEESIEHTIQALNIIEIERREIVQLKDERIELKKSIQEIKYNIDKKKFDKKFGENQSQIPKFSSTSTESNKDIEFNTKINTIDNNSSMLKSDSNKFYQSQQFQLKQQTLKKQASKEEIIDQKVNNLEETQQKYNQKLEKTIKKYQIKKEKFACFRNLQIIAYLNYSNSQIGQKKYQEALKVLYTGYKQSNKQLGEKHPMTEKFLTLIKFCEHSAKNQKIEAIKKQEEEEKLKQQKELEEQQKLIQEKIKKEQEELEMKKKKQQQEEEEEKLKKQKELEEQERLKKENLAKKKTKKSPKKPEMRSMSTQTYNQYQYLFEQFDKNNNINLSHLSAKEREMLDQYKKLSNDEKQQLKQDAKYDLHDMKNYSKYKNLIEKYEKNKNMDLSKLTAEEKLILEQYQKLDPNVKEQLEQNLKKYENSITNPEYFNKYHYLIENFQKNPNMKMDTLAKEEKNALEQYKQLPPLQQQQLNDDQKTNIKNPYIYKKFKYLFQMYKENPHMDMNKLTESEQKALKQYINMNHTEREQIRYELKTDMKNPKIYAQFEYLVESHKKNPNTMLSKDLTFQEKEMLKKYKKLTKFQKEQLKKQYETSVYNMENYLKYNYLINHYENNKDKAIFNLKPNQKKYLDNYKQLKQGKKEKLLSFLEGIQNPDIFQENQHVIQESFQNPNFLIQKYNKEEQDLVKQYGECSDFLKNYLLERNKKHGSITPNTFVQYKELFEKYEKSANFFDFSDLSPEERYVLKKYIKFQEKRKAEEQAFQKQFNSLSPKQKRKGRPKNISYRNNSGNKRLFKRLYNAKSTCEERNCEHVYHNHKKEKQEQLPDWNNRFGIDQGEKAKEKINFKRQMALQRHSLDFVKPELLEQESVIRKSQIRDYSIHFNDAVSQSNIKRDLSRGINKSPVINNGRKNQQMQQLNQNDIQLINSQYPDDIIQNNNSKLRQKNASNLKQKALEILNRKQNSKSQNKKNKTNRIKTKDRKFSNYTGFQRANTLGDYEFEDDEEEDEFQNGYNVEFLDDSENNFYTMQSQVLNQNLKKQSTEQFNSYQKMYNSPTYKQQQQTSPLRNQQQSNMGFYNNLGGINNTHGIQFQGDIKNYQIEKNNQDKQNQNFEDSNQQTQTQFAQKLNKIQNNKNKGDMKLKNIKHFSTIEDFQNQKNKSVSQIDSSQFQTQALENYTNNYQLSQEQLKNNYIPQTTKKQTLPKIPLNSNQKILSQKDINSNRKRLDKNKYERERINSCIQLTEQEQLIYSQRQQQQKNLPQNKLGKIVNSNRKYSNSNLNDSYNLNKPLTNNQDILNNKSNLIHNKLQSLQNQPIQQQQKQEQLQQEQQVQLIQNQQKENGNLNNQNIQQNNKRQLGEFNEEMIQQILINHQQNLQVYNQYVKNSSNNKVQRSNTVMSKDSKDYQLKLPFIKEIKVNQQ